MLVTQASFLARSALTPTKVFLQKDYVVWDFGYVLEFLLDPK
jgi:hypothetical protein